MFLSLKDYLKKADKLYSLYTHKKGSEDDISTVAEYMIRADNKYNSIDECRDEFRELYGRYGIKAAQRRKQQYLDYCHKVESNINLDDVIDLKPYYDNVGLEELCELIRNTVPEKSAHIFILKYVYGYLMMDIAEAYGITPQRVFTILKETKKTLREELYDYV